MAIIRPTETPTQDTHDLDRDANALLWQGICADPFYKDQADLIMSGKVRMCDIDPSMLGFVGCYWVLSRLVPRDRVVYDLGCAYGMQAWFFRHHKRYVGVDYLTPTEMQLHTPCSEYHTMSIRDFLAAAAIETPHFAICNYVPPWHGDNEAMVREAFQHLFVYYP